jgi:hypothetical protein
MSKIAWLLSHEDILSLSYCDVSVYKTEKCEFHLVRKLLLVTLLFIVPISLIGQIIENFETGTLKNWTESVPGRWKADSAGAISGKYSLHHIFDNPDAGTDQIGLQTPGLKPESGTTKWSFRIKHGYDPSSSNNWGVFLTADNSPINMVPGGRINGFVIGVNLTGYDDTLRLWKIKNGSLSVVLTTRINWQNNIGSSDYATIKTERSQSGLWCVKVYTKRNTLADSSSASGNELFSSNWLGIYYKYSSTRDRLLWIDDISIDGTFFIDTQPPEIISTALNTFSSIDISLDEEPSGDFFSKINFALNDISDTATSVTRTSSTSVRIFFDEEVKNKTENVIFIKTLCDKSGNCRKGTEIKFTPARAETGDVIISEIMADPSPTVSLPEKEYLEILNRTDFRLNLKKWKLSTEASGTLFPDILLQAHERMILCQVQDTASFSGYGKVCGIKSFPALTIAGRILVLSDSLGKFIHGVEYSSEWNNDNLKKNGGWSLEIVDPDFPFYYKGNWAVSVSKGGGTPGSPNSSDHVNRDRYFGGFENVFPADSSTLIISFSEPLISFEEHARNLTINGQSPASISKNDLLYRSFIVKPSSSFQRNTIYIAELNDVISDFSGNRPKVKVRRFGITEKVVRGDILFNELLFNPLPEDTDFVEFYNNSNKVIDASELLIASLNDKGIYSETNRLSSVNRCILPGTYFTITTRKKEITDRYPYSVPENIYEVLSMPSMPDDKGHLVLLNKSLDIIDEVRYDEKMHFALLSGNEGISLEKVRTYAISADPQNWVSASQGSGWGTPGGPNSVAAEKVTSDNQITFSSTKITPDNDGFEDFLVIEFNFIRTGNIISVSVFDESGRFIRKVAENFLSAPHTTIVWNGTDQSGSLVTPGIYVMLINVFNEEGGRSAWKRVCSVLR